MKAVELTQFEARQKAQAEDYLAEAQRILRGLQQERRRRERQGTRTVSVLQEVKLILRAA